MKNHIKVDGQLLQTNKTWSHLKERQKQKISEWFREETVAYYTEHGRYPMGEYSAEVVDRVYDRIKEAGIWIPYGEVYKHYIGKKQQIINRLEKKAEKTKRYVDATDPSFGCSAVFSKDAEIVQAGTTIYSMPVSCRNEEYDRIAKEWGIHFIFEDEIPAIDFYSVPRIDIFATDGDGGLFGTVGQTSDFEGNGRIVYIKSDHTCYLAGQNAKQLMAKKKNWKSGMKKWNALKFYPNAEAAKAELPFIESVEYYL